MSRKTIVTLIISTILIVCLITIGWIYRSAMDDKMMGHTWAEEVAKENGIKNIKNISTYYSDHAYYIVAGSNDKSEHVYAFIPKDRPEDILTIKEKDGLSKDDVLKLVFSFDEEKKPQEIIAISLGYDDSKTPKWDIPVWEVRYIDQKNRYTYFIVSFTDPQVYKSYSIQQ
ncbi:DUF5590 domain-containing protein [Bacillus alveayuensis]|uniref:cell wall elongation regulator TseB-like domain-containing protein n=1 Tax=Aeribacillus alveayuensis TaxID=279215 RepID=UPI0005CD5F24|nr:DUF5590 domain-containing protein [Bacillus alveayuensis]